MSRTEQSYRSKKGDLPYVLVRSNARRTSSIQIDESARVSIYVPYRTSQQYVDAFIREKFDWILKCVETARDNQKIIQQKKYEHGGRFLFLGKKYPLHVIESDVKRARIDFDGDQWKIVVPEDLDSQQRSELIRKKLIQWYRLQAEEILGGRIFHYSRIIGETPERIAIRSQKRMWGCCDYNKRLIHLNWQIILSPIKVIDYIVVHELCHLIHPNHSKRFWRKVESVMPEYEEYKHWLKVNHTEMMLPL